VAGRAYYNAVTASNQARGVCVVDLTLAWRTDSYPARRRASFECQAARAVGVILTLIGLYLTVAAVLALANRSSPETTVVGVALSAASVLVLPILAQAKLRLAQGLASSALQGDGVLSLAGAGLTQLLRC
jgi:hypothetical protein